MNGLRAKDPVSKLFIHSHCDFKCRALREESYKERRIPDLGEEGGKKEACNRQAHLGAYSKGQEGMRSLPEANPMASGRQP